MPRNIYNLKSKSDVVRFAKSFIRGRTRGFEKDISVCLTNGVHGKPAYMPALMTCLSFLDLLSGLYAGDVSNHGREHFLRLIESFAPAGRYQKYDLKVLYVAFRHKLAHLGHPAFVLDTAKDPRLAEQSLLLSWRISSEAHEPPIRLEKLQRSRLIRKRPVPYKVRVDHYMHISIRTLADDAVEMANSYLRRLEDDVVLWKKFRGCIGEFYQARLSTS